MGRRLRAATPTRGRFNLLGDSSILAALAPTLALIGFAITLPACCCGGGAGGVPLTSPVGTGSISGRLLLLSSAAPRATAIYAVRLLGQASYVVAAPRYVMTRVDPSVTTYGLTVPNGYYFVIARSDSDPLGFGGYTNRIHDKVVNGGDTGLAVVAVGPQQVASGVDIGDWGTADSLTQGWWIDVNGLPLLDPSQPSPSDFPVPARQLPAWNPPLSSNYIQTPFGARFLLPVGWSQVKGPASTASTGAFFANETVASPLNLDDNGVWLSVVHGGDSCDYSDRRFAVAVTNVSMFDGPEVFYFEDPPPRAGPQPFEGYGLSGGAVHGAGKQCIRFTFVGVTRNAFESNLATIGSLLLVVNFGA
jgi:hypothetical protein